jgi:hypothetical protein
MKHFILGRAKGKTITLIKLSAKTGDTIVCADAQECRSIQLKAIELDLKIPFPITYYQFKSQNYVGVQPTGFLIDNADNLLQSFSPAVPIKAITMNEVEKVSQKNVISKALDLANKFNPISKTE